MRSLSVRPAVAGDVKQQTLPRERLLLADIVAFAGLNTVANTGTYDVVSNNGIAGTSGSLFVNDGLFEKTGGGGVSEVTTNFINSGELNVLSGSIEFSGGFTNTGVIHGLVTESGGVTTVSAPVPSDFNGDALSDLLWRGTNGDAQIWESNGSGGFSDQDLGVVDNSYQIAATADFNGDGKSDMLWRNANGDAQIWNSNGSGGFIAEDLGIVPTSYQVAGTGDFNGDGEAGILWRNSNGDTQIWNSNGSGGFTGEDLGGRHHTPSRGDRRWRASRGPSRPRPRSAASANTSTRAVLQPRRSQAIDALWRGTWSKECLLLWPENSPEAEIIFVKPIF
jgi:hypothetical protein